MPDRLTRFAKDLRKTSTDAEVLLWSRLRAKQFEGIKFRRQQPIDGCIVDFVTFERRVIVEVDGGQHAESTEKDIERDRHLRQTGFKVLRFWNNEVLQDLGAVLEVIRRACSPSP